MSCDDGVAVLVQAAGAPGVTAVVPAEVPVRDSRCCVKMLPSIFVLNSQAAILTVTLEAVLDTLATLDLNAHADPVAAHLCDNGFEDRVPVSSLVKLLRDAGVPPARAVAVKNTVTRNPASPV
jgi:hypothetical protein